MNRFTATLASGQVLNRGTARTYSHAWAVHEDGALIESGFARTAELARAAAQDFVNSRSGLQHMTKCVAAKKRAGATPAYYRWLKECIASHGGADAWAVEVQGNMLRLSSEVVPAVAA